MKAFLTGATGFVGGHLLDALLGQGAQVRCLVRRSSPLVQVVGRDVELVEGDLRDPASFEKALEGCTALFHCAADYRLFARRPLDLYESNVEGTRHVLRAAERAGVRRVVYTSSVGALGLRSDGRPADESTPVAASDMIGHYKRSKFLAERVAESFAEKGLFVVIVNPSTPVGERDVKPTATGRIVLDYLNGRTPAYVDTGLNLIDVRDVAAGHCLAATKGRPGRKYILGHQNLALRDLFELLSEISGHPAPRIRLPHAVAIAAGAVDTTWARLRRREPRVPLEAARLARYKMYFDATRAVEELGLPQTPIREALERAVRWFRDAGYTNRPVPALDEG